MTGGCRLIYLGYEKGLH